MTRAFRMGVALVVTSLLASGCYGPFNLTRQLHHWNGQAGDKYVNELVFVAFAILPVYGVTIVGDAVLFNSIEFWTGHNPVLLSLRSTAAQRASLVHPAHEAPPNALE
ncbi:MAG: DUF3332 family protein [Candidatus Omnitrophica bacterium]|nr:DUF3332 family protein [Candidatus Omnitrophota bacterium]